MVHTEEVREVFEMNINDVKDEKLIPDNIWKEIWDKQMTVAQKYKEIESMGDLLETVETNIDTRAGQKWIKDFAWRTTEEIAEVVSKWSGIPVTKMIENIESLYDELIERRFG